MFLFCLSFVPIIGYWHKGLKIKTFLPIDCSRRLKHLLLRNLVHQVWELWLGLRLLRWQKGYYIGFTILSSFFFPSVPCFPQIWYWRQGLKSFIRFHQIRNMWLHLHQTLAEAPIARKDCKKKSSFSGASFTKNKETYNIKKNRAQQCVSLSAVYLHFISQRTLWFSMIWHVLV